MNKWGYLRMSKICVILYFTLVLPYVLSAQNNDLVFEHLTIEDGLSNNFIRDIAQDSSGFMWFATEDGLNKYDGYKFTVYRHNPDDPASLSENKVEVLQVAENGIIWVGTNGGGLNAFNPLTEKFIHYNMDPDNPHLVGKEYIYDLYLDKNDRLWFSVQPIPPYRCRPHHNHCQSPEIRAAEPRQPVFPPGRIRSENFRLLR